MNHDTNLFKLKQTVAFFPVNIQSRLITNVSALKLFLFVDFSVLSCFYKKISRKAFPTVVLIVVITLKNTFTAFSSSKNLAALLF